MPASVPRARLGALLVVDTLLVGGCAGGRDAAVVLDCPGDQSCGASTPPPSGAADGPSCAGGARALPDDPQTVGDPVAGYFALLDGSYMSCGLPLSLWDNPLVGPFVQAALGSDGVTTLPGRSGDNAGLPSSLISFTTVDGAKVVNLSCLKCHGGSFDGEYLIGLPNVTADFTSGLGGTGGLGGLSDALLALLPLTPAERGSLDQMMRVARQVAPYTAMRTVGNNPAEALSGALFSHHDQATLAWSDTPLLSLDLHDDDGNVIANPILTSDPPPWWRVKKKRALFYNGMSRGQHRGTEEIATLVCVRSVDEAARVDAIFRDIQAYLATIPSPTYHRRIDGALAARGQALFGDHCACCHGTYAADAQDDAHDSYPNLIVPLDEIGTDRVVAKLGAWAPAVKAWYDGSFYAQVSPAVTNVPFEGYVAPPLDGVWATAPYLHNGSVPTIDLVLDSRARPKSWRRVDYDSTQFDEDALGWPWQPAPAQADAPAADQKYIYDTTLWGQGNGGHSYGDGLTADERRAIIEYLKTL